MIGGLVARALFLAAGVLVTQVAWNFSISPLFGLPEASFFQSIGLLYFIILLRPSLKTDNKKT